MLPRDRLYALLQLLDRDLLSHRATTQRARTADSSRAGRLAAAMAWPWRFSFSPGMCSETRGASSGKSARRTSCAVSIRDRAARSGHDAAKQQHVPEVVHVRQVGQRVAEVGAERQVHVHGAPVAQLHQRLHVLEARRQRHGRRHLDLRRSEQATRPLLRQVLHDAAVVARPLVARGVGAVIDRHERDLVEPRRDAPVRGHVAARGAGSERHAQHGAPGQRHRTEERGHVAVIDDVERDAVPGPLEIDEHVSHPLLERVGRDAAEQGREPHLVGDVDAGRAAADGVDVGQVLGRASQRIHDPVPVILRILLVVRDPTRSPRSTRRARRRWPPPCDRCRPGRSRCGIRRGARRATPRCSNARAEGRGSPRSRSGDRRRARRRSRSRSGRSGCRDNTPAVVPPCRPARRDGPGTRRAPTARA